MGAVILIPSADTTGHGSVDRRTAITFGIAANLFSQPELHPHEVDTPHQRATRITPGTWPPPSPRP
ncbi:MAG: hypothetical protein M3302_01470, partial [Actinomycetota bacterium]|nr:hypothetical protein [Actinomycetota bacterium]